MKRLPVVFILVAALFMWGCSSGMNADELFETASLEEKQDNIDHALELYRELLKKYPDSIYSRRTLRRIKALETKKVIQNPKTLQQSLKELNRTRNRKVQPRRAPTARGIKPEARGTSPQDTRKHLESIIKSNPNSPQAKRARETLKALERGN